MLKKFIRILLASVSILLLVTPLALSTQNVSNLDEIVDVKDVREFNKAGTYFVQLSSDKEEGGSVNTKARLHVTFPKTVLDFNHQEGIDAHDILVKTGTFDPHNDPQIIKQGDAHAWSLETGEEITPVNVTVNPPIKYSGTINNITYKTNHNTAVNVNVFEQEEIYIDVSALYMSQIPILQDSLRVLSLILLAISLLPILVYGMLISYVKMKSNKVNKLINDRS